MNFIVALQGKARTGKTNTHGILRNILLDNGYDRIPVNLTTGQSFTAPGNDFVEVLERDGVRIGICSAGDIPHYLNRSVDELIRYRCQIIFASCRTAGGTVSEIEDFYGFRYTPADHVPIYKLKLDVNAAPTNITETQCNQTDANLLFEISERLAI